jgi:hypothetical protein
VDLELRLDAVIVAVTDGAPRVLALRDDENGRWSLPSATLSDEATLDRAVRAAIEEQAGLELRSVEQLYTFGDVARRSQDHRTVSIAYLALVQETELLEGAAWLGYYDLLPWEDHRSGTHPLIDSTMEPLLRSWVGDSDERLARVSVAFGDSFDGVRVLDRYELLYEAQLVDEWWADQQLVASSPVFGEPMHLDDRRIVATALGRIRGKLSYRPVVFDLLAESFTLLELQRCVEALAGVQLHKQNFRRLIERAGLVEGTGQRAAHGGRPAELFRYRPEVQLERSRLGVGQPYR